MREPRRPKTFEKKESRIGKQRRNGIMILLTN